MRFHFCKISIEEAYIYRLLNLVGEISIRDVKKEDGIVSFIVEYADKQSIIELLHQNNIKIVSSNDDGIYRKIFNRMFIKIVTIIFVIFILLLIINSFFIWNITVDGNYSYTTEQIIEYLRVNKITEGIKKHEINCDNIEKQLRNEFEDFSWVCAEIKGTNLIIHVKENYITEISKIETNPYNIVADTDGTVVSIITRKGKANVKKGDKVKKGDILISGLIDINDESGTKLFTKACNADGEIVVETVLDYKDSVKISYNDKVELSKKTLYFPTFFNWHFFYKRKKDNTDVILSDKKIKLFGNYYIPLSIQQYKISKYKIKQKKHTKSEAEKILNNKLLYNLAIKEQKDYKILKKDVRIYKDVDSYVLEAHIYCQKPAGKVSFIDEEQLKQLEEGTTETNERN